LALEIDPAHKEVHRKIAANFEGWAAAVEQCLNDAQIQGKLPAQIDRKRLARFVLCVMEGGVMQARSHRHVKPFDMAVEELRQYFDVLAMARARHKGSPSRKSKSRRRI
jgi:hypothetical protein